MCGIAGYIIDSNMDEGGIALRRMAAVIAHRGPDDEGFLEVPAAGGAIRVGLAHRRLSIIDLSAGHQPIGNEEGSIQIVFNGEIYNYQSLREQLLSCGHVFRTHSDTEVIVHAYEEWGDECVLHFRGMFAFAIWDGPRERLFLARDRFGKKPLYLHESKGRLLFASEIKSILAFPGVEAIADKGAIWDYFSYRYVPGPATLFSGVRKLLPGFTASWEGGRLSEHSYYTPPDGQAYVETYVPDDVVGAFLGKLDESVRIRMVSDVPFGAFLSGGIDSSAVVCLMSKYLATPVKTFSVGFSESAYSELGYAKTIADHFSTEHHELIVSQEHLMGHLPTLIRYRDAPVAEPSDIPIYLLSMEARRSVKMVLTGEGSDEFLGGYPKHVFERYVRLYQKLPKMVRSGLIEPLISSLPYRFRRAKTAIVNLGLEDFEERMQRWFGALSATERSALVALFPSRASVRDGIQFSSSPAASALRRILYFDQTSWLPDNLLERGDRMTMAASIEARMPFMDQELAAFVSSLPDEWRVQGRTTKRILREAMKRLLPAAILERPKVGFRVPVNEWFRSTMREYLYDHLAGTDSITRNYYSDDMLKKILTEHIDGRQNHEKLLWTLLNLEIWHREYKVGA